MYARAVLVITSMEYFSGGESLPHNRAQSCFYATLTARSENGGGYYPIPAPSPAKIIIMPGYCICCIYTCTCIHTI